MVNIRHLKPVVREQMVKPYGLRNKLLYGSIWGLGKFHPYIVEAKFSDCTTSCIEWNVIWTRTRSMYLFFFVRITMRRVPRCFYFYFHEMIIYCANSPPSPVHGSYFVIVSYCHTSHTFNNVYPSCTAFWNSTDTQVPERDRSPTEWLHIDWFSVSARFLHNTNINFIYLYEIFFLSCGYTNPIHCLTHSFATSL